MRAEVVLSTVVGASLMTFVACSDAYLQPKATEALNLDDRLAITGRVCTRRPNPAGFPVKVVLVVDQSGSMCVSDPPGSQENSGFCEQKAVLDIVPAGVTQPGRVMAIKHLLNQFQTRIDRDGADIQVALVPFDTNVSGVWPSGAGQYFAPPDSSLLSAVDALQGKLGKGTDYQGALAAVYKLIEDDIGEQKAADLPRSRYVVVFLTDGTPFPRCASEDHLTQYADDLHPDLLFADSWGAGDFCNQIDPEDPDAITTYIKGTDRNQNYQLYSYINQLMELKSKHNIGDIRLNTVLLFNQQAVTACGPICQDLYGQYVRWPGPVLLSDGPAAAKSIARYLLKKMADMGNGVFQEYNDFGGIGILDLGFLNYTSLASNNVMKTLLVQPLSSEPGPLDLKSLANPSTTRQSFDRVVDSDGDGLPDELDNDKLTPPTSNYMADSDGDGFDDNFEVNHKSDGFLPNSKDGRGCDGSVLHQNCDVSDSEGDGLSEYAEGYLHTDPDLVDTDGDGIPDGMEVRYGLDPLSPQTESLDTDGDGYPDTEEFRLGSNPVKRDKEYIAKNGFQFSVVAEEQPDKSVCYDFTVSNIQLVTPPDQNGLPQGFNLFKVWFAEAPETSVANDYGVWKTGCVWAQYAPPSVRVPAGPTSTPLTNANFVTPDLLSDRAAYGTRCVGVHP